LATAEFVGEAITEALRQLHRLEQLVDLGTRTLGILCPAVHHQGFSDAVGNGQERVEARRRVLEHEADLAAQWPELAFTNAEHLLPEYLQRPAAHPGEAGDRATDRRLARTTLTDE